jgi:hypothetical protein
MYELLSYYTCNERRINQTHLSFSLYTKCQINTTAFANLHINNVDVKHYNCYVDICFSLGNTISLCITYHILITPLVSSNSSYPIITDIMSCTFCKSQKDFGPIPIPWAINTDLGHIKGPLWKHPFMTMTWYRHF